MNSQQLAASRAAIPEFPYERLDESRNEIRVLTLLPSDSGPLERGGDDEPPEFAGLVRCEMENVSLDATVPNYDSFKTQIKPLSRRNTDEGWRSFSNDSHRATSPRSENSPLTRVRSHSRYHRFSWGDYGALSYAWGDQTNKVPIVVNGVLIKIGRNLEAALRALTSDPDYSDGLKLWADAICINQRDMDERNKQVKRMGGLFGGALLVTMWLGEVAADHVQAMRRLHECVSKCKDEESAEKSIDEMLADPDTRDAAADSADYLAKMTYWSRVWIIQEKCLGPWNPSIVFGQFRFPLMSLRNFFARATNIREAVREREKVWRILKLTELAIANQEKQQKPKSTRGSQSKEQRIKDADDLALLLMLGRLAGAMDQRDKLYGLMGMIPEYVTEHITPDYGAPVEQVFCDFARALVTGFESFDLVLTGTSETDLALPSWVPDLSDSWDPYLWGTKCSASGDRPPQFRIERDGKELVVSGFQVDVVDGTAPRLGWDANGLSVKVPAVQPTSTVIPEDPKSAIVRTLYRDTTFDCSTGLTLLDIPWADLLDSSSPQVKAMEDKGWGPVIRHASIVDFHLLRKRLDDTWNPWGRDFKSFFPSSESVPECQSPETFTKALDKHFGVVYPIITTAKGRFGTSIRPVQTGDLILVVLGCSAPVVVRPNGDGAYQVISQCYVEGLMTGEGLLMLDSKAADLKDWRLV